MTQEGCQVLQKMKKYFILEFIEVYQKLPSFWKVKCGRYSSRNKNLKSHETLQEKYKEKFTEATSDDVKKIIQKK